MKRSDKGDNISDFDLIDIYVECSDMLVIISKKLFIQKYLIFCRASEQTCSTEYFSKDIVRKDEVRYKYI